MNPIKYIRDRITGELQERRRREKILQAINEPKAIFQFKEVTLCVPTACIRSITEERINLVGMRESVYTGVSVGRPFKLDIIYEGGLVTTISTKNLQRVDFELNGGF